MVMPDTDHPMRPKSDTDTPRVDLEAFLDYVFKAFAEHSTQFGSVARGAPGWITFRSSIPAIREKIAAALGQSIRTPQP